MSILKYMPPKDTMRPPPGPKLVYVQAKVPADLRDKIKAALKKDRYTIKELIEKSFLAYLEEKEKQKQHAKRG